LPIDSHLDDNDILALVSGTVGPELRARIDEHLDACSDCRMLAAASAGAELSPHPAPAAPGEPPRGAQSLQLGRYSVLRPLGAGAMGIVYAAYDPELDRRVALKLLHSGAGDGPDQRARLLKEAQAMARLSHPNVIAVHDVGTVDGRVFVAMEFVEGQTLAHWMKERHPWREVLRVFLLAGRGLAAAHHAGVIHRDFKPDNVLIGNDGRVRVTDFGLARSARKPLAWSRISGSPVDPASLSDQGMLVGSPAYMAPEQMDGALVDARADEFSFCVALYEALYGERPFAGGDLHSLRESIERREVQPAPPGSGVPGWVRRVLLRGMQPAASERFGSLEALLDVLETDPVARAMRYALGGLVLALAVGAAFAARAQLSRGEQACRGAEQKMQGVWDPARRGEVQRALAATRLPYADAAWSTVSKTFDRYAAEWVATRTDACEATAVRREQSPELLELRVACLDDRLGGLAAASRMLASGGPAVVSKATAIAGSLQPISDCSNTRALREPGAPRPEQRAQIDALNTRLAELRAERFAGQLDAALPKADALLADAKKLGFAPLEAAVLYEQGKLQSWAGRDPQARRTLAEAAAAGLRARTDPLVAAAWTELAYVDVLDAQNDDAQSAMLQAKAAAARLPDDSEAQIDLGLVLSLAARASGQVHQALLESQRTLALAEKRSSNTEMVRVLGELALSQEACGERAASLDSQQRAFALASAVYGEGHLMSAEVERDLAHAETVAGYSSSAQVHAAQALERIEQVAGPASQEAAQAHATLGESWLRADPARALASLEKARSLFAPDSQAETLTLSAQALIALGRRAEAQQRLEDALALAQRLDPAPGNGDADRAMSALGSLLVDQGQLHRARPMLEFVLAVYEKLAADTPPLGLALYDLARLELAEHKSAEGVARLQRALALVGKSAPDSADAIRIELALAAEELARSPEAARARLERIAAIPIPSDGRDDPVDRARTATLLARAARRRAAD